MKRTYRYRIYLTAAQISYLENAFSMCRYLYNWNLEERVNAYKKEGRTVTYAEQQNNLPGLKDERPWFKGVYSLVLQDVLRRLDRAYQNFFRQKRGFPNYKKKGQWGSITYADHHKRPEDSYVKVGKIGPVKIIYHREIPPDADIKTLTIIKEGGKWFACFSVELPDSTEPKRRVSTAVGIDLGIRHFFSTSDGAHVDAGKFLAKRSKDLKRLMRKLSSTKKKTSAYRKALRALQKAHYRLRCKRSGFLYEKVYELLGKVDLVIYENLDIQELLKKPAPKKDEETGEYLPNGACVKKSLHLAIQDASWGKFVRLLREIAEKLGKHTIGVDPRYTSQKCSGCAHLVKKSLSERTHRCSECGVVLDRDHNAAINILRLGLESLGMSLEAPTITLRV